MATDARTAEHVAEVLRAAGAVSLRRMFGEYAVYLDGKVVGLICDNQLFLKDLPEARAVLPDAGTGSPYPRAKPHLLIDEDLDDEARLCRAVQAIAAALPPPKPKKAR